MILVDVHAHVDLLDDPAGAVERAEEAGVKAIISNGIDPATNRKTLGLAEKFEIVKPALGLYPIEAEKLSEEAVNAELDFIGKNKDTILGVGEVGLDGKHATDMKKQKVVFGKFIELSEKLKKPLIVHTRMAEAEILDMLGSSKATVDLHCFEGNKKLVKKAADLGYSFSVPTNIVKSEHFQNLVKEVDISQIMTETDCPFLSPFEDKKNEPAFVIESVKKIAEIKGLDAAEVANNVFMNYQRFF